MTLSLELLKEDPHSRARVGVIHTPHGQTPTPVFAPVDIDRTQFSLTISIINPNRQQVSLLKNFNVSPQQLGCPYNSTSHNPDTLTSAET